jgi:hypothetical protein
MARGSPKMFHVTFDWYNLNQTRTRADLFYVRTRDCRRVLICKMNVCLGKISFQSLNFLLSTILRTPKNITTEVCLEGTSFTATSLSVLACLRYHFCLSSLFNVFHVTRGALFDNHHLLGSKNSSGGVCRHVTN